MKKILFLGLLLGTVSGFAQSNAELNTLIRQSFIYFPHIQELNKSAEISELRVNVAQSNYLPSVTGVASYTYLNPISQKAIPVSATETQVLQFQPYNNYNFNVDVNQVIWDFGKTQAQIEKAKADLLVARLNTTAAKLQVAAQVASVYYAMIYLKRSAEVQDTVISFYAEDKKIIEGKIKQGDALQIDLSTIENNIDQEQNRRVEFLRLYQRQAALLRFTTGQTSEPTGRAFDFQPVGSASDFAANPDLMAATERIAAARADAKLAENNKYPVLSLRAAAGVKNGYQPDIDAMRFNYLGGVSLNFPIFQGGRVRQNIAIAHKSAELSEISKNNIAGTLQKDFESVQSDLNAYEQQIKNSEGQIAVAKETQRLTQVRYRQGVATYLDLINASANLQRAYLNQLQYEYQRTLARVEMSRLMGVSFWEG